MMAKLSRMIDDFHDKHIAIQYRLANKDAIAQERADDQEALAAQEQQVRSADAGAAAMGEK